MLLKKRQIITATLIIALCAALTVNWYFTKPENTAAEENSVSEQAVTGNLGDTLFVAGTTATDVSAVSTETTGSTVEGTTVKAEKEEYFSEAKLKREKTYDETLEAIEKIVSDESLPESEKGKISVMLSDYQRDMKAQTDAENLISAKSSSECLVVINGENCQVILEKNTLNNTLALQITEIIEKNTNIFSENLTIIELK